MGRNRRWLNLRHISQPSLGRNPRQADFGRSVPNSGIAAVFVSCAPGRATSSGDDALLVQAAVIPQHRLPALGCGAAVG